MARIVHDKLMDTKRWIAVAGVAVLGTLLLGGCMDKTLEPFHDSGIQGRNDHPAEIINMPDGFSNLADKCVHGDRIFVGYHGDSNRMAIAVVGQDPTCPQVP